MRKTRKMKGGAVIDLRQILLTKPIFNMLKESNISISEFTKQKGNQGFRLHKYNTMKNVNINTLEPVVLKETVYGKTIDGVKKRLYEIVDGRHRITRAIIMNKKTIKATII